MWLVWLYMVGMPLLLRMSLKLSELSFLPLAHTVSAHLSCLSASLYRARHIPSGTLEGQKVRSERCCLYRVKVWTSVFGIPARPQVHTTLDVVRQAIIPATQALKKGGEG